MEQWWKGSLHEVKVRVYFCRCIKWIVNMRWFFSPNYGRWCGGVEIHGDGRWWYMLRKEIGWRGEEATDWDQLGRGSIKMRESMKNNERTWGNMGLSMKLVSDRDLRPCFAIQNYKTHFFLLFSLVHFFKFSFYPRVLSEDILSCVFPWFYFLSGIGGWRHTQLLFLLYFFRFLLCFLFSLMESEMRG